MHELTARSSGEVLPMDIDDAKKFLLKCSGVTAEQSADAAVLVETLGWHPLAIQQAGGFINKNGVSVARYCILYDSQIKDAK